MVPLQDGTTVISSNYIDIEPGDWVFKYDPKEVKR